MEVPTTSTRAFRREGYFRLKHFYVVPSALACNSNMGDISDEEVFAFAQLLIDLAGEWNKQ
jgi:hypothetical protein